MGFERLEDLEKVLKVIGKRFAKYGLRNNEEKTRKVRLKRPFLDRQAHEEKPGTFDFLGFTLYWGRSRKGKNIPKVKTARKRYTRALASLKEWGWANRHLRLREQQRKLNEKLQCKHPVKYSGVKKLRMTGAQEKNRGEMPRD